MPEPDPPPPLNYSSPNADRTPLSVADAVGGTFLALLAGPGVAVAGGILGEMGSTDPYAGLGGLVIGAMTGGLLTLILLGIGIRKSRSENGRRRGFGIGLLIGSGFSLLGVGVCFAMIS